jgi:hypothetical protein
VQAYCSGYKFFLVFAVKKFDLALFLNPPELDREVESASVPHAWGTRPVPASRNHQGAGKGKSEALP